MFVHKALIAAGLTAAMILLFLGNWRSTCIIAVSIPLSIMCSLITLYLIGETINLMTMGALALAVGILVDDATVEIENIEPDKRLAFHSVKLGRDFGREAEILEGIASSDILIASPSNLLAEGEEVNIVEVKQTSVEKSRVKPAANS